MMFKLELGNQRMDLRPARESACRPRRPPELRSDRLHRPSRGAIEDRVYMQYSGSLLFNWERASQRRRIPTSRIETRPPSLRSGYRTNNRGRAC